MLLAPCGLLLCGAAFYAFLDRRTPAPWLPAAYRGTVLGAAFFLFAMHLMFLIDALCAQRNPDLGVRNYRTNQGFRVLITGADAPPRSEHAARIMEDLNSDSLYMRLCRVQECYRARLTPKPWRIGMRRIHGAGPWWAGTDTQETWTREYNTLSQDYAVCELVSTTGPEPSVVRPSVR